VNKNTNVPAEGSYPPVYQARLSLSTATINRVASAIARYRQEVGSRWRKVANGRAALIVLAHLRHDQRLEDLAGGAGVSASTVSRWVEQVLVVLARQAERLGRALARHSAAGAQFVLLDGTLVRTRRRTGADNRRNYSGKHKAHGLHVLAITDGRGNLLWISAARPGRTHDNTAARRDRITARLRHAGLGAICDLGFTGLEDDPTDPVIITGRRATRYRRLTDAQKSANTLVSRERCFNEHGFADLKNWRILAKLRRNPAKATVLLRAECQTIKNRDHARRPA
jgi:hypothetical protein